MTVCYHKTGHAIAYRLIHPSLNSIDWSFFSEQKASLP